MTHELNDELSRWATPIGRAIRVLIGLALGLTPVVLSLAADQVFEIPKQALLRVVTLAIIVLWLAGLVLRGRLTWQRTPLDLPVAAWAIVLVVGTVTSATPIVSLVGEYGSHAGLISSLIYVLLFFATTQHVRSWEQAERLLFVALLAATATALYGLLQGIGLDFIAWAPATVVERRAFATLGNPLFLAGQLVLAIPLAAGLLLSDRPATRRGLYLVWGGGMLALAVWIGLVIAHPRPTPAASTVIERALGVAVLVGYALALLATPLLIGRGRLDLARRVCLGGTLLVLFRTAVGTGSRGPLLGLTVGVAILAFRVARARQLQPARAARVGALAIAVTAILAIVSGPELGKRLWSVVANPTQAAEVSRLQIWRPAVLMVRDHPLLGVGLDGFKSAFPRHASSRWADVEGQFVAAHNAHCEPLHIAATLGLVGLGAWLLILAVASRTWWRRLDGASLAYVGLGCGLIGFTVQNLLSFSVAATAATFWILLAVVVSTAGGESRTRTLPTVARGLLALLAVGIPVSAPFLLGDLRADIHHQRAARMTEAAAALVGAPLEALRTTAHVSLRWLESTTARDEQPFGTEGQYWLHELKSADAEGEKDGADTAAVAERYRKSATGFMSLLALTEQERATELAPLQARYHAYLGRMVETVRGMSQSIKRREQWTAQALAAYQRARDLNPENAYYRRNLGRLHALEAELGKADAVTIAERYLLEATELAPTSQELQQELFTLYARLNQPERVVLAAEQLAARDPDGRGRPFAAAGHILLNTAGLAKSRGDDSRARNYLTVAGELYERAATLDPQAVDVAYSYAVTLTLSDRQDEAKRELERALALDPKHPGALSLRQRNGW